MEQNAYGTVKCLSGTPLSGNEQVSKLKSGLEQRQIPIISGLRATAVFLVIFYHSGLERVPAGLGVLLFFVISGFLITWLLLKENQRHGKVSLRLFYARRSLRIFPAFYAYAALSLVLLIGLHKPVLWPQAIASLLYVENYYQALHGDPGTAFSHTWSLGIEEQFYLFWPILFVALRQKPRLLIQVTGAIIAAVWIYRFVLKYVFHVWQGYFYEAFDTRMDHLLIGCLLALALFHFPGARIWDKLCNQPLLAAATVGLLLLSVAAEFRWEAAYRDTWGFIINPVCCAVLIPQLISLRTGQLVRWLDWKPVQYLGSLSYSLYLYQQLVLQPVRKAVRFLPFSLQLLVSIAVLIVVATLSYQFIEAPFLKIKDRYFRT